MTGRQIEIEDLGTMRECNPWQANRIMKMRPGHNRCIAPAAFGLGMTLQQFKKLPTGLQKQAMQAYYSLTAPEPAPSENHAQEPYFPRPGEHVPLDRQIQLGRYLLAVKAKLPHGHFGPWLERDRSVTASQAQRWMKAASSVAYPRRKLVE